MKNSAPSRKFRPDGAGPPRAVWIALALVVLLAGLGLAVPRFLGGDATPAAPANRAGAAAVAGADAAAGDTAPASGEHDATTPPAAAGAAERVAPPAVAPAGREGGDLEVEVRLAFESAVSGASLPATLRFTNGGLEAFDLPAPGEPWPTLALVVLDAEGNEVRRVVESGPDPYPRLTRKMASGASLEIPVRVVSGDDEPLPAGEYTVYAEFRRDPVWSRLGLPMWKAAHGPARSPQAAFRVLTRAE